MFDQWRTEGGGGVWGGGSTPPPEIPKALQNRAKLNPIVKTVKNCWIWDANAPKMFGKKRQQNSKTTAGSQLFYISNDK